MMKIWIASDHAGVELKKSITDFLKYYNHNFQDLGPFDADIPVDYPHYAHQLCSFLLGDHDRGILICGSGHGMAIAANRYAHVRAVVCHDVNSTSIARQHNNANILCLGARFIKAEQSFHCIDAFLKTEFEGGRHQARIELINTLCR